MKWYGCLPQILLGPFLNTLSQIGSTRKQTGTVSKELLKVVLLKPVLKSVKNVFENTRGKDFLVRLSNKSLQLY